MAFLKTSLVFILLAMHHVAEAQPVKRYQTFSYSVNEGLLQSTIFDLEIDKNNFCWISFPGGLQKFDGQNFSLVSVQPGLPDDKGVVLFKTKKGELLLGHSHGISHYDADRDVFSLVYQSASLSDKPVFLGEDAGIIYFSSLNGSILEFNSESFSKIAETRIERSAGLSMEKPVIVSSNIINRKIVIAADNIFCLWDLQKRQIVQTRPMPFKDVSLLQMKSDHEILYLLGNHFIRTNLLTGESRKRRLYGPDDHFISRYSSFSWHGKNIMAINENLFETDSNYTNLESRLVDFRNQPIAGSPITSVKKDNFGNLWISTLFSGLRKVLYSHYQIKYYTSGKREATFAVTILPDKANNRVLLGTLQGLFVFDTTQKLVRQLTEIPGLTSPLIINQILQNGRGDYFLFVAGAHFAVKLSKDLNRTKLIPLGKTPNSYISYFANTVYSDDHLGLVQSLGKIYRLDFHTEKIEEFEFTTNETHSAMLYGDQIISFAKDELIFLDAKTFHGEKKIPFPNTGGVRCFAKGNDCRIYLGTNKGIFKIDSTGSILEQYNRRTGLPDDCIYSITHDDKNNLWVSTNKGIIKISSDKSFLQITREDGLQENEFNTNAMAISADGEFFYGGVDGGSSFYPGNINPARQELKLLVTNVRVNNRDDFTDKAAWNINRIELPYDENSLAFDFIAMGANNPGQYTYQYKMKGIDDGWISNENLQTVRYFLPPGEYVFQMYASRYFDPEAKAGKEIFIQIAFPFWKTWWFTLMVVGVLIAITAFIINRLNREKYQKKLRLIEAEKNIQTERERISRDLHDNIGGYANTLIYKTELLKNDSAVSPDLNIINDLGFASKDIITSLRETVWALKKKDYSAEECLIRISNFIKSFAEYYQNISFEIAGDVSKTKFLSHAVALHVVRMVQEAVTNAVRHARAQHISIINEMRGDQWHIIVGDDGCGFDVADVFSNQRGNGIANMEKRGQDANVSFSIDSRPGEGTRVFISV